MKSDLSHVSDYPDFRTKLYILRLHLCQTRNVSKPICRFCDNGNYYLEHTFGTYGALVHLNKKHLNVYQMLDIVIIDTEQQPEVFQANRFAGDIITIRFGVLGTIPSTES